MFTIVDFFMSIDNRIECDDDYNVLKSFDIVNTRKMTKKNVLTIVDLSSSSIDNRITILCKSFDIKIWVIVR